MISRAAVGFLSLALLTGCGDSARDEANPVLKFAAIPDQNTTELRQRFAPLIAHLSAQLGVPVEWVPSRDYQAAVEMFRNAEVQLAWFGGLTGVQARAAVPGAQAIAQGAADPKYFSYVIAHAATGLVRGEDFPHQIAGHTFTFGSASSTSGRLMPEYFIREATGLGPEELFKGPVGFSGSHDKTCEWVESGQFAVGVVNYKVYDRRVASGQTDPEQCRVIWQTPYYADYNFTAHPVLETLFGTGFTEKLQAVLLAIDDPELLSALPRERLIAATNDDFVSIAEVARQLGMVR